MKTDAKQKTKTVHMIGHDSDDFENRLVNGKKDFTLRFSNYTTIIETNGYKYLFSNSNEQKESFAFFHANKKIANDVKKAPYIDKINERDLIYFDSGKDLPNGLKLRNAYNVDIKSAYIRTAFLYSFISKETFEHCMKLEKSDRLKAFGMLATNYTCFDFKGGKVVNVYSKKDDNNRNYFFAVVKGVSEIMQKIKNELSDDFLFYWVDGIYFKTKKSANIATELFKENGYETSFDCLKNFSLLADDFRYNIQFGKKDDKKVFTVPKITRNANVIHKKNKLINEFNRTYNLETD
jgi:hypothetical protein